MYCPKCAAQNVDDARFCRACGSDISLVPQALAGNLPESRKEEDDDARRGRKKKHKEKREKPATVEAGVQSIFGGIGFLLVSVAVYFFGPAGHVWFFWLFLPAFAQIGRGVGQIMRARREQSRALPQTPTQPLTFDAAVPPAWRAGELPPRDDSTSYVPPSITEGTTRHLSHAEELRPRPGTETRAR